MIKKKKNFFKSLIYCCLQTKHPLTCSKNLCDMDRKRKFYSIGFQHICQKSADNGLIFYDIVDRLVFFTTLCIKAAKMNICIIAIAIMLNHFHISAAFRSSREMDSFMNGVLTSFARRYNFRYRMKGQVFKKSYASSSKYSDKQARNNVVYINNNHKEKHLVCRAENAQWNLMKYLENDNPFSEKIDPNSATPELLSLIDAAQKLHAQGEPIGYRFFSGSYSKLSDKEKAQLVDYIIVLYNAINKQELLHLYGSYENLCAAVNAVSGDEYEIRDDVAEEDYRHYDKMIEICRREGYDLRFGRFLEVENNNLGVKVGWTGIKEFGESEFTRLCSLFQTEARASDYEISKFFHTLKTS